MKYYTYFPGCSAADGGSKAYGVSTQAAAKALDTELLELEDWNCCGSTPCSSVHELSSLVLSARNLALAQKLGFDLVTPCSCCYVNMNRTNTYIKKYPKVKAKVDEALAAGKLQYNGSVKVRTILDMFVTDIGYQAMAARVKKNLSGVKIAPYYGCQIVRPRLGFDDAENPQSLDRLIVALGGQPTVFPYKSHCCGGSLIISEENMALELMRKLLDSAKAGGAEVIATVCPLCQTNLDAYQSRVNKRFGTDYKLPVLFFTQLMGLAFGLSEAEVMLGASIVPPNKLLAGMAKGGQ